MCSIGDDGGELENISIKNELPKSCNKCKVEKPCVVLRTKDVYCKDCFLAGATHKFKAVLGKSKLLRPNDRVLISHKIGHASTALLHLIRSGLDLNTPKKLRFVPIILFVDDQYHISIEERKVLLSKVVTEVESFDFKLYFVSLADYISKDSQIGDIIYSKGLQISDKDEERISEVIDRNASKTYKQEIKNIFERNLLIDAAKYCGCKFVFTPEISIDIASNLLTNMSLGKGSHIPIDAGFCDDRDDYVKILRPLRAFDLKELALYNTFNNIESLSVRQPKQNPYSSVQNLLRKFVVDLQVNFPATITTVLRTGDKLAIDKEDTKTCELCRGTFQNRNDQLNSEESTNFSSLASTETIDYSISGQERYKYLVNSFNHDTVSNYCFSCSKFANFIIRN